jgi:hypothetical protein
MDVAGAAKMLRDMAELTASNSKNWDNFELIAADMLKSAYKAEPPKPEPPTIFNQCDPDCIPGN